MPLHASHSAGAQVLSIHQQSIHLHPSILRQKRAPPRIEGLIVLHHRNSSLHSIDRAGPLFEKRISGSQCIGDAHLRGQQQRRRAWPRRHRELTELVSCSLHLKFTGWVPFPHKRMSTMTAPDPREHMAKTIAELLVEHLKNAGVKRVYGLPGDSLNGFTDALRRDGTLEWVHVRNEEVAAFAAGADAHLTGSLAVCAASCGPGNLHLINGLFDCHRSRVPVLAIAAHIPSSEIGTNYFQETHPQNLFKECSDYCEMVGIPEQMPRVLDIAMRTAINLSGVAVLVIPGDVALHNAPDEFTASRPSG